MRPASAEEGLRLLQAFRAIGCVEVRSYIVALAAREAERFAAKAAS